MRPPRILLLVLLAVSTAGRTRAEDPPASTIPPELIVKRFAVAKGGDFLLVPVRFAGKDRVFLLDTGCTLTAVDESLVSGEPEKIVKMVTPGGPGKVKIYGRPEASIGDIPLDLGSVMAFDLRLFREQSGHPIEGILGMDFLGRYVLRVDLDRGELLLIAPAFDDPGEVFPLLRNEFQIPQLEANVSPRTKVRFLIDTGMMGWVTGMIDRTTLDSLKKDDQVAVTGSHDAISMFGKFDSTMIDGIQLSFGPFSVGQSVFSSSPNSSILGLNFLSRFVVTFDFPRGKLHLEKGKAYERKELEDAGGLGLSRKDGKVIVDEVEDESPGAKAGLKVGDVILALGMAEADRTSLFELRKALCKDQTIVCSVRRGDQNHHLILRLAH